MFLYKRLLNIINLTFSFCYNDRTVLELKHEIRDYLKTFSELYPTTQMIPKMHFLTHFPDQLEKFGCLRNHATQRMEAKNGAIKKPPLQNYRNVCKTIAYQQEFWFVSQRLDANWKNRKNYLSSEMHSKNSREIKHDNEFCERYSFEINNSNSLYECDELKCFGFMYKIGDFIITKDNLNLKENVLGKIIKILMANDSPVFKLELFDIQEFVKSRNCFRVKANGAHDMRYLKTIVHKHPVFGIDKDFVQIRYFFNKLQ